MKRLFIQCAIVNGRLLIVCGVALSPYPLRRRCPNIPAPPIGWVIVIIIGITALLGVSAYAQEVVDPDGPVIIGGERPWESIHLDPFYISLDLLGRRQVDQVKPKGPNAGPTRRDVENYFREALTLSTSGFIGHRNFVDLNLSGTFGLTQEFLQSDTLGGRERTIETFIEYDASALILRESEWPLRVYSTRSQLFIDRQFADTIDSTVTQHGAFLQWRSPVFPSTFHYFHREEVQTSRLRTADFGLAQDTFEWSTNWQPDPHQQLSVDYTFDAVEQSGFLRPTTDLMRHHGLINHSFNFGSAKEHNLRSSLSLFHETGDFPSDRIRFDESLRLRHNPQFETLYDYSLDWLQTSSSEQISHRGTAGFRHQFFESLVTTGSVGASLLQVSPSDFTSREVFGRMHFDYHKRVPLGRLSAGVFGSINLQDDSEQGVGFQILDEQRVFGPSGIVVLTRRNIDPTSIIVTDASGLIIYTEGVDYTVQVFGDQVEVRRILGGDIGPDEFVLVDYFIGPEPAHTTTTLGAGTSVRYDFDEGPLQGLGLYARYFHQDQDRSPDLPGMFPAADIDEIVVGADYRVWHLFFRGEHQIRDSTVSPFNATRLEARYLHPLGRGSLLSFNANYDMIDRTEEDFRTTITTIGGRWTHLLTEQLSFNLSALWRNEHDSNGTDVQGFEQRLDVNWRHRQTTVYGSVRNAILESNASDSMFQTFMLGVRREF